MEKKLEVKNLKISFKTSAGKVQAVRDISFDLYKGETLAIVGESGSGKSVTSKAIMGILAGNSLIEGGEILYDGQDLLKIEEEDFHKLRGNKISMIFQDPMSSLNPIVKVGRQLTEAMILKGKARQRECRSAFNKKLRLLLNNMVESSNDAENKKLAEKLCKDFNAFEVVHLKLENEYNLAKESCKTLCDEVTSVAFELEKNVLKDTKRRLLEICDLAKSSINRYVVWAKKDSLISLADNLKSIHSASIKTNDFKEILSILAEMLEICKEPLDLEEPNFFALGYYEKFANKTLPNFDVDGLVNVKELNAFVEQYFEESFNKEFKSKAKDALINAYNNSNELKKKAIIELEKSINVFSKDELNKKEVKLTIKNLKTFVINAINRLETKKDSIEYTFIPAINSLIDRYFVGEKKNEKEENRFEKENTKINKIIAKGKIPDWKPVPPSIIDFDATKESIVNLIVNLIKHFEKKINELGEYDFDKATDELIEFLKENASGVANKLTKAMAKAKSIKVMEEVGIPDARRRFYQYPFQFSGGMRQRIVIAIALVSNPDILICDEPTTALDVTIQANILELINKLKRERQLSIIFITHDLGVVANMADHVAVMYAGKIVEYGAVDDIFYEPAHPYTWALLASIPDLDTNGKLDAIPGTPPNMIYPPVGDAFAERNKYAMQIDFEQQPPMFKVKDGHYAATWLLHPNAPKVTPPQAILDRIERLKSAKGGTNDGK